jgi:predicted nucleic acid-binding protein
VILADTSVWIDYLRQGSSEMERLLAQGQIRTHPFIVAELSLGSLRHRKRRLEELDALLQVPVAQLDEVRHMIETQRLYAKGIGLTDAHLIASCLLTPGTLLWTRDAGLGRVAKDLAVLWTP